MRRNTYTLTKARIHGLERNPYLFGHRPFFVCDITFTDHEPVNFGNLTSIKTGNTKSESDEFMNELRGHFRIAGIQEGCEVLVLLDAKNEVVAITTHKNSNYWIDVVDKYTVKIFYKLSILSNM